MAWGIGATVLAGLAIGCVGSSRTTGDYTKKAVATAEHVRSSVEARFHTVILTTLILAAALGLTSIDPIKVT